MMVTVNPDILFWFDVEFWDTLHVHGVLEINVKPKRGYNIDHNCHKER